MNGFRKVIFLKRCCDESSDRVYRVIGDEFREGNDVWWFVLVDNECRFRASDQVHDDVSHDCILRSHVRIKIETNGDGLSRLIEGSGTPSFPRKLRFRLKLELFPLTGEVPLQEPFKLSERLRKRHYVWKRRI
jgi:hypothetical protein